MSPEEEVLGLPYILDEVYETKRALKSKLFSQEDISAILNDTDAFAPNTFGYVDLAIILWPLNNYLTKIALV